MSRISRSPPSRREAAAIKDAIDTERPYATKAQAEGGGNETGIITAKTLWAAIGQWHQRKHQNVSNAGGLNVQPGNSTRLGTALSTACRIQPLVQGSGTNIPIIAVPAGAVYEVDYFFKGIFYLGSEASSNVDDDLFFGLEAGLQFRYRSAGTWSSWIDCRNSDYAVSGTTYYDQSEFADGNTIECDNAAQASRMISVYKTKLIAKNPETGTYYADLAPPGSWSFTIGTDGAFPQAGLDYQFRWAFASAQSDTDTTERLSRIYQAQFNIDALRVA